MIRNVDLVSHLPTFLVGFHEVSVTLDAENPEFILAWKAADQTLQNEFIETADEYGIARFEQMLHILPSRGESLENRRSRVQIKWLNTIPYTIKALIMKLKSLSGDKDFTILKDYDHYQITIVTDLERFGQVDELITIINSVIPCNLIIVSRNQIPCRANGFALASGGVCAVHHFVITNDANETYTAKGNVRIAGRLTDTNQYIITNDAKETITVNSKTVHSGGATHTATVVLTNDFNAMYRINGENQIGSGAVISEYIGTKQ